MKKILFSLVILQFFLIIVLILFNLVPTGFVTTSIEIKEQVDGLLYEESIEDTIFQITFSSNNSFFTYNSTVNGTRGGVDIISPGNGVTEFFTLLPAISVAGKQIDVTIKAEDFRNGNDYIDVSKENGNFQILIPGAGWKNVPDGNSNDADGIKDPSELCIANNLTLNENIPGFDFRIRSSTSINAAFQSQIKVTAYSVSDSFNPCSSVGEYVVIQ